MKPALAILKNRWFWTALVVIIILFILWKNQARIKRLFRRDVTDYTMDPPLTEARKTELRTLTQNLFAEFDGITWSTNVFETVVDLNNSELRYVAEQYPAYSGGESLREAIEAEAIAGDEDGALIARLNAMNL